MAGRDTATTGGVEMEPKPDSPSMSTLGSPDDDKLSKYEESRKSIRMNILSASWFEPFILAIIIINCVVLALENPKTNSNSLERFIQISEYVFTAIYIIEMIVKMYGWGFIGIHDTAEKEERDKVRFRKTREQGASVFSYMVNSVFHSGQTKKKDEYRGYFMDGWNWLDFIIVIVGSILPYFFLSSSVSSIRALRILRALRTIPRVPKLRTLVMTLIDSMPGLTGAALLLLFFFIVFGIIGIQLFQGILNNQCWLEDAETQLIYEVSDQKYWAFCEVGDNSQCSAIYDATDTTGDNDDYVCEERTLTPNNGMESWNDIFYSLLQVFQIVTLQEWSRWMYDLASVEGNSAIALYFVPLIFIVSFFALNLVLAVIVDTYSNSINQVQHEEDYDSTLLEMDDLIQQKTTKRSAPVRQTITYRSYQRKVRSLKEKVKTFEDLFKEYNAGAVEKVNKKHELTRKTKMRVDTSRGGKGKDNGNKSFNVDLKAIAEDITAESKMDLYNEDDFKDETWQFSKRAVEQKSLRRQMIEDMMLNFNKDLAFEVWLLAKPIKDDYLRSKPMFVKWCHWVSTSEWFEKAIVFIILLNTIILAISWPHMDTSLEDALLALNICFTVLFLIEMCIKMIGLGLERWAYDRFNIFDAAIVLISVVELFLPGDTAAGALLAFRALRVLRVLRLLHKISSLRILLNSIIESFEPVFFLLIILILFLFMFGVLGVQLFSESFVKADDFEKLTRPWRFDNLWYSMVFMMQLFSGDGWPEVMGDAVEDNGKAVAIVFVICVIIGLYIFKNMFLAILINRLSNQDNIQLMIDDLLSLAREKQAIYKNDEKTGIREFENDVKRVRQTRMGLKAQAKHESRIAKLDTRSRISGKSFMIFAPSNEIRKIFHNNIVNTLGFEWTINVIIIINCVFLAMDNPHVTKDTNATLYQMLKICDWIFTLIFVVEALLKMFVYGVYESKKTPSQIERDSVQTQHKTKGGKVRLGLGLSGDDDDDDEDEDEQKEQAQSPNDEEDSIGPCENAYFKSWWNRLDFFIVVIALIGLAAPEVGFLRGLRAIRPIRVAIRIPLIRVVVKALIHSAPNVANAILFAFFLLFVMAVIGVHLFSGQLGRCVVIGQPFELASAVTHGDCDGLNEWINPGFNFDNVFIGLLTVFKIGMFSNWYEDLSNGMASVGQGTSVDTEKNIIPYNRPFAAIYFVGVVIIMGFFVFNIIISVVVDSFNRIKRDEETNALLTQKQVVWVRKRRFLTRFPLKPSIKSPENGCRKSIFEFVNQPGFEYFIIACILLNTLFLMTEHYTQPDSWTTALFVIEIIFVAIYSIEAILKLIATFSIEKNRRGKTIVRLRYFNDLWNVFDFIIVVVSIFGFFIDAGVGAAVVRLLRVARIVRLIKRAPILRALFLTLVYAAPSIFNIGLLLLVIFFIWGIFGMEMFGEVVQNDGYGNTIPYDSNDGLSKSINFEYFGNALLILYRTATNDNWGSILLAAGAEGGSCPSSRDSPNDNAFNYQCGSMWMSILYFVSFGVCGTLFMINLFVAVILDTYVDNVEFEKKMEKLECLHDWIQVWKEYDEGSHKKLKSRLPVKRFISTLRRCPVLVGLVLDALNLRLNIEEAEAEMDYKNVEELMRRSSQIYKRAEFVGPPNVLDDKVEVTNDHINALMKTRRLRILCKLVHRGGMDEKLVVFYSDALFAIASLVVGPEHRLLPYNNDKMVHISDWWGEQLDEFIGDSDFKFA